MAKALPKYRLSLLALRGFVSRKVLDVIIRLPLFRASPKRTFLPEPGPNLPERTLQKKHLRLVVVVPDFRNAHSAHWFPSREEDYNKYKNF